MSLSVYLDTQDISNFADVASDRTERNRELYEACVRAAKNGIAVFYYGALQLSEALQFQTDFELARHKAVVITSLCGRNVVRHPFRVMLAELQAFKAGQSVSPASVLGADGDWWPDFDTAFGFSLAAIRAEMLKEMQPQLPNRRARRAANRVAQRMPLSSLGDIESKLQSLPISRSALKDRVLTRFLAGQLPNWTERDLVVRLAASPEEFLDFVREREGALQQFPEWMSAPGARLAASVENLREQAQEFVGVDSETIADTVRESLPRFYLRVVESIATRIAPDLVQTTDYLDIIERCPGVSLVARTCVDGLLQSVIPSASMRKPSRSDMGDALHTLYLPYVDCFRADRRTAELLKQSSGGRWSDCVVDGDALLRRLA